MQMLHVIDVTTFCRLNVTCELAIGICRWPAVGKTRSLSFVKYMYHVGETVRLVLLAMVVVTFVRICCGADFAWRPNGATFSDGVHSAIPGQHALLFIQDIPFKHDAVACCTSGAEWYAGCFGYNAITITQCVCWCCVIVSIGSSHAPCGL